jgi:hypothetical protein
MRCLSVASRRFARRGTFVLSAIALATAALVVSTGGIAGAAGSMQGESFVAGSIYPASSYAITDAACGTDPGGGSHLTFAANGVAEGIPNPGPTPAPVPGSWTETGTITWNGTTGAPTSVNISWSLSDLSGVVVTGTKTIGPFPGSAGNATCVPGSTPLLIGWGGGPQYTANFTGGGSETGQALTNMGTTNAIGGPFDPGTTGSMIENFGPPPVAPPAPTVTANPNVNLSDGQTVQVSGSGLQPNFNYSLRECIFTGCDPATAVAVTTSASGTFGPTPFVVSQHINVPAAVDCAVAGCAIAAIGGPPPPPFAPISFAPAPLHDGHTIFPPGSPFTGGTNVATGFPSCPFNAGTVGPLGLIVNATNIFGIDACNQTTYRFPLAGGNVGDPGVVSGMNGLSLGAALANGTYYGIASSGVGALGTSAPGLYSFDPGTLALGAGQPPPLATIPGSPLIGQRGVADDPLTTDVYVTSDQGIFRVQNPGPSAIVTTFVAGASWDGIAFTSDGSRLYAVRGTDSSLIGYDRNANVVLTASLAGHGPDGIAVVTPNTTVNTSTGPTDVSNNVFVNSNDGTIERVDTNSPGNPVTVVALGGSRGDFATVGPDHCMYVTQSSTIERLSPCVFQPAVPQAATLTLSPKNAANPVGTSHTVTATAKDSSGNPAVGITVKFSVSGANTATGTGTTNASGEASFTYTGNNAGPDTISAYADNNTNGTRESDEPLDTANKLWFTKLASGSFVIGDNNAAIGASVTYWGSQWAKQNSLSGGSAPSSFKGFAGSTGSNPPACGASWSTGPGNSADPPPSVPQYMAVIVTSSASKSGSTISGNTRKVVIVKTNPGYDDNPGHAGTATVVGVLCTL